MSKPRRNPHKYDASPADNWFYVRPAGDSGKTAKISGIYVVDTENDAGKMAAYIREEDGVNARVYQRSLRVEGVYVDLWLVAGHRKAQALREVR